MERAFRGSCIALGLPMRLGNGGELSGDLAGEAPKESSRQTITFCTLSRAVTCTASHGVLAV